MDLVAVDVSKEKLDVFYDYSKKHEVIENSAKDIKKLISKLKKQKEARLVFEASGAYEKLLKNIALDAKIPCSICNGLRVREYARSQGKLAKTDKIDCRLIADYAKKTELPIISSRNPVIEELRALNTRRKQILAMVNEEENKLEQKHTKLIEKSIKDTVKHFKRNQKQIEEAMESLIEKDSVLKKNREILETIPGIAKIASITLLSDLPELGKLSKSKIASLGGLAPMNRDSGKFKGKRKVGHSRGQIKAVLYMSSMCAIRHNPRTKEFYERLKAKGKPGRVILVACMRKLLVQANAMLKKQEKFKA